MEGLGQVDEAHHLLAGLGGPGAAVVIRVARQHHHRAAVEAREPGDDRAAEVAPISKKRAAVDHRRRRSGASCRPGAGCAGSRSSAIRRARCGSSSQAHAPAAGRGPTTAGRTGSAARTSKASSSVSTAVSIAPLRVWMSAPPSSFLSSGCPSRATTGGPATNIAELASSSPSKWLQASRAAPRPATEPRPRPDHRHLAPGSPVMQQVAARAADAAGQVGRAPGLDGLHRAAAARAFDDPHDRQAQLARPCARPSAACC